MINLWKHNAEGNYELNTSALATLNQQELPPQVTEAGWTVGYRNFEQIPGWYYFSTEESEVNEENSLFDGPFKTEQSAKEECLKYLRREYRVITAYGKGQERKLNEIKERRRECEEQKKIKLVEVTFKNSDGVELKPYKINWNNSHSVRAFAAKAAHWLGKVGASVTTRRVTNPRDGTSCDTCAWSWEHTDSDPKHSVDHTGFHCYMHRNKCQNCASYQEFKP